LRITIVTGFFLPVPPLQGGATERSWYGLARLFAVAGHEVTLISRQWPGLPDTETADGVLHRRVRGFDHSRRLPVNLLRDLIWGRRVARALPAADVTICNTVTLPAWLPRRRPSAGAVAVMIGRRPKGQMPFYGRVKRIYLPSSSIADEISSGDARARLVVTGYPIDWERNARAAAQRAHPVTIGYIGRLHPEKGLEVLLAAARLLAGRSDLPAWKLQIVGPAAVAAGGGGAAWLGQLKAQADVLGNRLEWSDAEFDAGRLAHRYGQLDIFCYPSLADKGETFGVAVAEAMAARCAVVVSALPCFRDLVTSEETGLRFDHTGPAAPERLAVQLGRLVLDAALRSRLALRGQEHARRYDYAEVSRTILADLAVLTGTAAGNPLR